jgi:hypothetical protein
MVPETMPVLTVDGLKALAADPEFARLAAAHIVAKTVAQATKERVDKYVRVVFDMFEFHVSPRMMERGIRREDNPITEPNDLFLSEEKDKLREYYALCDVAHRTAGYNLPEGHCPALIARCRETDAENALLQYTDSKLGTPFADCYLEKRDNALDLILGIALQNPATERIAKETLPKNQAEAAAYLEAHNSKK